MNNRISQIIEQMGTLEEELRTLLEAQQSRLRYQIEGHRIVFEQVIREAHQRVKLGVFRWFLTVRPQNYLTMPIIYGAAVPLLFFDFSITLYQWICFPVYRIARVSRADYIVFDHQHLAYLNVIEKFHCLYCSYAVGLLAYAQEIIARTEQYFCPIKHARKVRGANTRYEQFLNYGDEQNFHERLEAYRAALAREKAQQATPDTPAKPHSVTRKES
ncbi:MAG TPA: hypothetical protein DHV67_07290 [Gallionella sp.]|nr:hypothetical protein [Gallionella sp.]